MNRFTKSSSRIAFSLAMTLGAGHVIAAAQGPCDIYAAAGTPCVAAHCTTRALFAAYNGALYQVRRTSDNATKDIGVLTPGGVVKISTQDSFLNGKAGTISIIYDQTTNHNDLKKSGVATWLPNGGVEGNATGGQIHLDGRIAYGIYVTSGSNVAYRNNATKGVATGNQAESMYAIVDGKRYSAWCCFDYGNAESSGKDDGNGTMEAIYWGTDVGWGGYGVGNGPWIAADLENGMFKGNAGYYNYGNTHKTPWPTAQSVIANYASLFLKGPSDNTFKIKAGDSQKGKLTTMWNGSRPSPNYSPKRLNGAIIVGTGGDGSNTGTGTFYEGAMTMGNPPDSIDDKIQANIVASGYGSLTTTISDNHAPRQSISFFRYDPSTNTAVASFALEGAHHVRMQVVDLQGKVVANLLDGSQSAGQHVTTWDARQAHAGVYALSIEIDGQAAPSGTVVVGR